MNPSVARLAGKEFCLETSGEKSLVPFLSVIWYSDGVIDFGVADLEKMENL